MNLGIGLIITLLCIIAFVFEIILYFIFGMGAVLSESMTAFSGIVGVFLWLMIMTAIVGVSAPIAGAVEQFTKAQNLGWKIFGGLIIASGLVLGIALSVVSYQMSSELNNVNTNSSRAR